MQLGMELKQTQTLKVTLTPQMLQSINMLQYSSYELMEFIQQQTVENPLLVLKEKSSHDFIVGKERSSFSSYNREQEYDPITQYSDTHVSLEKHLMEQIMTLPEITSKEIEILKFLIGDLNRYGFLEIEPAMAAKIMSVSLQEMENTISILQSLDPVGVGARNIRESLLIQMRAQTDYNPLAYVMVENHLEDIAEKKFRKIAKTNNVTLQEVQEATDYIKTLNPRPCSEFSHEMTQYIVPDVIIEKVNGEYIIIVNDRNMPQLDINPAYKNNEMDSNDDYVKKKLQDATMLMNGMEQRKYTLYKVTQVILKLQEDFFNYGGTKLKPMTLKDVSKQLGFHESTISRATSNKYMQTPHGLYHIKNLFTTGIRNNNSVEAESSSSIKEKIKMFIDKEDKENPISDQIIVTLLQKDGIQISRRTVAKYREEARIPGSSKRRRY
ncbi:MAG TPA: RNA polymerase factor sigma-54 [Bacillus sp. (in: firmicutes)]|nr:RNA polymerase factor sigma-54 [Bacillus sp. (in: firmicutes)]